MGSSHAPSAVTLKSRASAFGSRPGHFSLVPKRRRTYVPTPLFSDALVGKVRSNAGVRRGANRLGSHGDSIQREQCGDRSDDSSSVFKPVVGER